jgi:hypothetical protein
MIMKCLVNLALKRLTMATAPILAVGGDNPCSSSGAVNNSTTNIASRLWSASIDVNRKLSVPPHDFLFQVVKLFSPCRQSNILLWQHLPRHQHPRRPPHNPSPKLQDLHGLPRTRLLPYLLPHTSGQRHAWHT